MQRDLCQSKLCMSVSQACCGIDTASLVLHNPIRLSAESWQWGARQSSGCNVFTYCPIMGGCAYGMNQTFPYQGCQLKNQPGSSLSPLFTPLAYSRGPPTPFTSGTC